MPGRHKKPPRLWQRRDGAWIIIDGKRYIRTGSKGRDALALRAASEKLADYIGAKHELAVGERNPDRLPIADVLSVYEAAKAPSKQSKNRAQIRRHDELVSRLERLNEFFGDRFVGDLKAQACRDFVAWRTGELARRDLPERRVVTTSTARRELEDLRSAVNAWHKDNTLNFVPKITLPEKPAARDRWLTRGEAARLVGASLGFQFDDAGALIGRRDRMTRGKRTHIARFILLGLYSGRREETIRRTQWLASPAAPWLDLEQMIYHGKGRAERETKKRRPPAKIADRLRPHLLRWQRLDQALAGELGRPIVTVIHKRNGDPLVDKIKTGWHGVLEDAGLGSDVVRHSLKHTAATWLAQSGTVTPWQAAGFLGITVEMLETVYAHHHPDFQAEAAAAFGGRKKL